MLVKVNDSYLGTFGLSNPTTHTVILKRAGNPPFEVAEDVAAHHIKAGVLVPVEVKAVKVEKEPEPVPVEPEEAAPVIEPAPVVTAPKKTTKRGGKRK